MNKPELQKRMQDELNLNDNDFSYHASDLYVVAYAGVHIWLKKNYEFANNTTRFLSPIDSDWPGAGKICIEIPFAGHQRK